MHNKDRNWCGAIILLRNHPGTFTISFSFNSSPQHFERNTMKYLHFWHISRRIFQSAWAALQILLNILSTVPGIFAKSAASGGKAAGKPAGLAKLRNISLISSLFGPNLTHRYSTGEISTWWRVLRCGLLRGESRVMHFRSLTLIPNLISIWGV